MTIEEWMIHKHKNPNKLEEFAIKNKLMLGEVALTNCEKQLLEYYICYGEERQHEVERLVAERCSCPSVAIKDEVWWLMGKESYSVFYKTIVLNELASFKSIDECVKEVIKNIAERPSYNEITSYCEKWANSRLNIKY